MTPGPGTAIMSPPLGLTEISSPLNVEVLLDQGLSVDPQSCGDDAARRPGCSEIAVPKWHCRRHQLERHLQGLLLPGALRFSVPWCWIGPDPWGDWGCCSSAGQKWHVSSATSTEHVCSAKSTLCVISSMLSDNQWWFFAVSLPAMAEPLLHWLILSSVSNCWYADLGRAFGGHVALKPCTENMEFVCSYRWSSTPMPWWDLRPAGEKAITDSDLEIKWWEREEYSQ